ncbi:5-formyltetrahydrofolate cyclo-ligase [Nicoletella semolina]|nr:5-formyltetrahydrofolate cyclo-ligase [Nicoletella semolina]MDH2925252.1 5-formyltetrahydrofolate cyclo-ligase [Nicoletella semolina]
MYSHSITHSITEQRQRIRKEMRTLRKRLSPQQQAFAAQSIINPALDLLCDYQADRIGFYLPFEGEISPLELMQQIALLGKKCYVPVLHPFSANQLLFLEYHSDCLHTNRFGILQPRLDLRKVLPVSELEMLFVPLVACDKNANRIGMGGGFYDRTLSQSPHLVSVGLAHRFQQLDKLPIQPWDTPLNHLILGDCE